jgi:hypothetical protein
MIMLMLKYKTHIEVFPVVHIVKECNNDEFKSSIAKSNMIHICSRIHKCE